MAEHRNWKLIKETLINENAENSPLLQDYIDAFCGEPQIVPNYQVKWNSILQEENFGDCLPQLAGGKMTIEEFLQRADDSVKKYEEEQ